MRPPSAFTRRVPALSAVLLLLLTTTGAAPVGHPPRTGRVEGHVRARSGTPLAHAQVFVVGSAVSALTDSAGRYALPMVAESPAGGIVILPPQGFDDSGVMLGGETHPAGVAQVRAHVSSRDLPESGDHG